MLPGKTLGSKLLTHGSRRILIDGQLPDQVLAVFGDPDEIRTGRFVSPAYRRPRKVPAFDEQWLYQGPLGHTLVFWSDGKVVLAVNEWSDW